MTKTDNNKTSYSRVNERRANGESENLEPKTPTHSPLIRETPWCSTSSVYTTKRSKET